MQNIFWLARYRLSRSILFFSLVFLFAACAKKSPSPEVGFYYWKTQFSLNDIEQAALDSLQAQKLYIRIFDVDWDFNSQQPIPKGSQSNAPIFPQGIEPTPTIYITNRTLLHARNIDSLAQKILDYTSEIVSKWVVQPKKIQLDVDWTATTKDKYFRLINYVKSNSYFDKTSVTIRLHQYKHPNKTGVPPADEGILMCYNTGKIKEWKTDNSIASPKEIAPYLKKTKRYPISLGIALPIFSWTVIFRDSSFYKIVSDADLSWQQDTIHFQQLSSNRYAVKSSTYLKGHYLYEGDLLRYETVTSKELKAITTLLKPKEHFTEILFYHLDDDNLNNYDWHDLSKIIGALD